MSGYAASTLMRKALEIGGVKLLVMVMLLVGFAAFLVFIFKELRDYIRAKREQEAKYIEHKQSREDAFTQTLLGTIKETQERNADNFNKAIAAIQSRDDKEDERHTSYITTLGAIEALARSTNGKCSSIEKDFAGVKGWIHGHTD